jgi:hypothetical protein
MDPLHPIRLTITRCVACLLVVTGVATPASALGNPLMVNLRPVRGSSIDASATLFGSGKMVLVNLMGQGHVPKGLAVTLNRGRCDHPGTIAFSLERITGNGSLTRLRHTLPDIADRAKSLVIHETSSELSPPLACGTLSD